ncbi:MAG: ferrous iron transport protein A [candidate division WOR-3 bacterium]|nr:MAG: ferrous iron transport protein A [candidate division WOR-3 bacterium]
MGRISLTEMEEGSEGSVTSIEGGHGLRARLDAMGIRPGVNITKVSGQFMRGPIIVRVGTTQIAIGFGMATRIIVEV